MLNLGNLFGGVSHGVQRGIAYEAEFMKFFADALTHGKGEELKALGEVAKQFVEEALDTAGNVKSNVAVTLLAGGDPFSGSRHMMQEIEKKFGLPKPIVAPHNPLIGGS